MIHQPAGGMQGAAADIAIHAEDILKERKRLNRILAEHTGQPVDRIEKDSDRDYYMSAAEAAEYGIIDEVVGSLKKEKQDSE
jgi:ATP-dependent Clp protease protease subunit